MPDYSRIKGDKALYVPPCLAQSDVTDCRRGDAHLAGKVDTERVATPDRKDILNCESGATPPALGAISHVVGSAAHQKMVGVAARSIVAGVAGVLAGKHGAPELFLKHGAMGVDGLAVVAATAVAVGFDISNPPPAAIVGALDLAHHGADHRAEHRSLDRLNELLAAVPARGDRVWFGHSSHYGEVW